MNKTSGCSFTVKQIIKYINSGKMNFDFPIQRSSGQWDDDQKSLLICSIVQGYDIPDIYIINSSDPSSCFNNSVLDGKQRCTTIKDYYDGCFKISNKVNSIVTINGVAYDIAGMYFNDLDEDVRDEFLDYSIRARKMNNFSDKEIEEQFFRLNNGAVFTLAQRANVKLGNEIAQMISTLASNNLFKCKASFSKRQQRSGDIQTCVLQTMMIIEGYPTRGYTNKDIIDYSSYLKDKYDSGDFNMDVYNTCLHLINRLYSILSSIDIDIKLKRVHIPSLLMNLKYEEELEIAGLIDVSRYEDFLNWWFMHGVNLEEYKNTQKHATANKVNFEKRVSIINRELLRFAKEV